MIDLAFQLELSSAVLIREGNQFRNLSVAPRDRMSLLDSTTYGFIGYSLSNLTTCPQRAVEVDFTFSVCGAEPHYASYVRGIVNSQPVYATYRGNSEAESVRRGVTNKMVVGASGW